MDEYNFLFNLEAWAEFEDAGIRIEEMQEILQGEKGNRIRKLITMARIMGNAYNRENGIEKVLDEKDLINQIKPYRLLELQTKLMNAISEGMIMETDEDKVHDVVLEEINRKKKNTD